MNREDCLHYSTIGGAAERFLATPGVREFFEARIEAYKITLCDLPATSAAQTWSAVKGGLSASQGVLSELEGMVEMAREAERRIQEEDFSEAQQPTLL